MGLNPIHTDIKVIKWIRIEADHTSQTHYVATIESTHLIKAECVYN